MLQRILSLIANIKLPLQIGVSSEKITKHLILDKKVKNGKIRLVLPVKLGKVIIKDNVSKAIIIKALKETGCK